MGFGGWPIGVEGGSASGWRQSGGVEARAASSPGFCVGWDSSGWRQSGGVEARGGAVGSASAGVRWLGLRLCLWQMLEVRRLGFVGWVFVSGWVFVGCRLGLRFREEREKGEEREREGKGEERRGEERERDFKFF